MPDQLTDRLTDRLDSFKVRVALKATQDVQALSGTPDGSITWYQFVSPVIGARAVEVVMSLGGAEGMDAADFGEWYELSFTRCAPPSRDVCPDWWFDKTTPRLERQEVPDGIRK